MEIDMEKNYWRYRPGYLEKEHASGPAGCFLGWMKDCENGEMHLMLEGVGDVSDKAKYPNKEALQAHFREVRPNDSDRSTKVTNVWDLCYKMKVGEIVFAVEDDKTVLGVGIVDSDYYYVDEWPRFHCRKVKWISTNRHEEHHGLVQKSFSRFDLKNEKSVMTLKKLLNHYATVFGEKPATDSPEVIEKAAEDTPNKDKEFIGRRVEHKNWGIGTILSISGGGADIQFQDGVKRMIFPIAPNSKIIRWAE